jgi:hypothetical protein
MVESRVTLSAFTNTVSYLPYLQLVAVICGFGSLIERDNLTKFMFFVACLVVGGAAILLSVWAIVASTGISHLFLSTADFTAPSAGFCNVYGWSA